MKHIMSDGDHRSVEELCDDDLIGELHYGYLHANVNEKMLAALTEIKKRLSQDNLDTKALELACAELSGWDCPPISSGNCQMQALALSRNIYKKERIETCAACWKAVLLQETADVDK